MCVCVLGNLSFSVCVCMCCVFVYLCVSAQIWKPKQSSKKNVTLITSVIHNFAPGAQRVEEESGAGSRKIMTLLQNYKNYKNKRKYFILIVHKKKKNVVYVRPRLQCSCSVYPALFRRHNGYGLLCLSNRVCLMSK